MGCSASRPSVTVITNTALENRYQMATSQTSKSSSPNPNHPKAFSLTTPLVHHPPTKKGDTHHLVSLTSTTYGYGSLLVAKSDTEPIATTSPPSPPSDKTHCSLLSPDSVINTWELMHGLDDDDDDNDHRRRRMKTESCRYPSLHEFNYASFSSHTSSPPTKATTTTTTKPLWKHLSEESLLSKMDPGVGVAYRRALSFRQLGYRHSKTRSLGSTPSCTGDRVVVYFTSLRGIRKTYEDCCAVRGILRGFGVVVDERDVSMDSELRRELQGAMPGAGAGEGVRLPQVFVRGRHVGGAEEIRRMNEAGELAGILEGIPTAGPGGAGAGPCGACGDVRFLPCRGCCGSRKVFVEEAGELRRCRDCNENGLIRCPLCCS